MSILETVGRRVVEAVETRVGHEIVPRDRMSVLESAESDNRVLRKTLEFIGFTLFNNPGSQPSPYQMPNDMLPAARIFAAGQAQRVWIEDPMAGQQIDLYVSFVFGRGVPTAQAHDDEVQDLFDDTWQDSANQRVLTSHERLVEKGIDLALQSNVYFVLFDGSDGSSMDGKVRLSLKRFEDVLDVVRHPVDQYRILYYKVSERLLHYDYSTDSYVPPPGSDGRPQIVYYEAYDAFDENDPVMTAQDQMAADELQALKPPASRLREGKIIHLAVNKTSEMAFGVPRMRRLMRWFTAYNDVLESHVNRMKAMASIYMKQTAKSADKRSLNNLALMIADPHRGAERESPSHIPGPGSGTGVLQENDMVTHTPFKIDSGATDVAASLPQLRAQVSGAFPPSYYGQDAGELAGAQSVELPVLKFIELDQEAWKGPFKKLAQARIDAAIRVGDLTEWRDPTEDEVQRIDAWETDGTSLDGLEVNPTTGQVKRDLSFEISLPSPLKRAMADLVAAAVQTATAVDPMGDNPELSRWLFGFILSEALDVDDPQRIVDQVLPRHADAAEDDSEISTEPGQTRGGPAGGAGGEPPTSTGADGDQHSSANPYGAKVNSPQPEQRTPSQISESRQDGLQADEQTLTADALSHLVALEKVPVSVNGNGTGVGHG